MNSVAKMAHGEKKYPLSSHHDPSLSFHSAQLKVTKFAREDFSFSYTENTTRRRSVAPKYLMRKRAGSLASYLQFEISGPTLFRDNNNLNIRQRGLSRSLSASSIAKNVLVQRSAESSRRGFLESIIPTSDTLSCTTPPISVLVAHYRAVLF